MKRIVRRVQSLNERAAELTAAAGQLPSRVAELRQAMTATTGELQTLKQGIQVNVADLQVSGDADLGATLGEVAAHAPVLAEAGYLLDGLDVEVSPVQRMIVQLVHFKVVETMAIQALIQRFQHERTVRAILSAILKARAVVDTIDLDGLNYHQLLIGIGPVPTIRLCWRDTTTEMSGGAAPESSWKAPAAKELETSFFGAPPVFSPMAGASVAAVVAEPELEQELDQDEVETETETHSYVVHPKPEPAVYAAPQEVESVPEPVVVQPVEPVDPLARFKVMPNLERR